MLFVADAAVFINGCRVDKSGATEEERGAIGRTQKGVPDHFATNLRHAVENRPIDSVKVDNIVGDIFLWLAYDAGMYMMLVPGKTSLRSLSICHPAPRKHDRGSWITVRSLPPMSVKSIGSDATIFPVSR